MSFTQKKEGFDLYIYIFNQKAIILPKVKELSCSKDMLTLRFSIHLSQSTKLGSPFCVFHSFSKKYPVYLTHLAVLDPEKKV